MIYTSKIHLMTINQLIQNIKSSTTTEEFLKWVNKHSNQALCHYVDHQSDINGETLLMQACKVRNKKIIELLIKNNAQVNAVDFLGNTALHHLFIQEASHTAVHAPRQAAVNAAITRCLEMIFSKDQTNLKFVLSSTNCEKETPLMLAARSGNDVAIVLILQKVTPEHLKSSALSEVSLQQMLRNADSFTTEFIDKIIETFRKKQIQHDKLFLTSHTQAAKTYPASVTSSKALAQCKPHNSPHIDSATTSSGHSLSRRLIEMLVLISNLYFSLVKWAIISVASAVVELYPITSLLVSTLYLSLSVLQMYLPQLSWVVGAFLTKTITMAPIYFLASSVVLCLAQKYFLSGEAKTEKLQFLVAALYFHIMPVIAYPLQNLPLVLISTILLSSVSALKWLAKLCSTYLATAGSINLNPQHIRAQETQAALESGLVSSQDIDKAKDQEVIGEGNVHTPTVGSLMENARTMINMSLTWH